MAAQIDHSAERLLGIVLVTASAAVFGLAGILTKSIRAEPMVIACWRGLVGALLITAYVFWRRGRAGSAHSMRLGWRGWLMAVVGAGASLAFVSAFKHTYVANVAIIYATAPFVAALFAWLLMRERVRGQTMLAAVLSLAGVGLMVFAGAGTGRPFGDGLALIMTATSALYMVLIRAFRETPAVWAGAVAAFLVFALAWFVADPLAVSAHDAALLGAFGLSYALASILWTEGARLIPSAEAGLLGSAEVPFAIVFGWLVLAEIPPTTSFVGGAVVLTAVLAHAGRDWLQARALRAA
ncbi:DMT family transporter [Mesorhizobium sp. KR1-2]|uniref:DMT family transporter n=1 Tax=Mesorhizobium sp. KR1-2 TaxID=3156609 RepID=UPI0032B50A60